MGNVKNIKRIKIILEWTDDYGYVSKDFATVQQLAAFLREYPVLGDAVGYTPKEKESPKASQ